MFGFGLLFPRGHLIDGSGFQFEQCFLTGTAAEIIAVTEIDRRPIGDGEPGAVTRELNEAFRAHAMVTGPEIG